MNAVCFSSYRFGNSLFALLVLLLCNGPLHSAEEGVHQQAKQLLSLADFHGGLVVHLGFRDGKLTAAFRTGEQTQVHGLSRDKALVVSTRQKLSREGVYGPVAVEHLIGARLPYVDDLVNLIIVEDASEISAEEIDRVLRPLGVVLTKQPDGSWAKKVKPWPQEIDNWTHYLHDPSGNAVAHDSRVGPPRHLQWVGSPRWSRHHDRMASMSALVSEAGVLYYIMDEGSRVSIQLPSKWRLIARDAFNGTVLWKRRIPNWQPHLFPLKSGPTQLARRLVAVDGVVYTTLGYEAPLVAIDGKTGQTLREYENSASCEEILVKDGTVYILANKNEAELRNYAPLNPVVGDQADVRQRVHWNGKRRVIMAFDAESGKPLWSKSGIVSPLSLCTDGKKLYFHNGERIAAVDTQSGEQIWITQPASRRATVTFNFGPRLVVHEDVVLYAGGDGKMAAYDAESGEKLWEAKHPPSGYLSPQDLLVLQDLVWCAPTTSSRDSGVFTGRDLRTGEIKREFPPDVKTYWFHHRCYIAKATDKFLIPSRTGIEFVDPSKEHWEIHHWVRGGCLYGVMPCNGLTYAPPHNCACYPEAKLYGFNALAPYSPTRPLPREVPSDGRLEKGPAYDASVTANRDPDDWPTYRGDNSRTGSTPQKLPTEIRPLWTARLGGRLTPPVISQGRVFVAQVDQHTVHALNSETGQSDWAFVAGGRVDSPPTLSEGRVVFGCADGWIYCLRADDGALIWRFRAAPEDRRLCSFEQMESVWPVPGSVLVENGVIYAVAGRSLFLDGGLRMLRIDLKTGNMISETVMDDTNPETGNNLQEVTKILQGPVGLNDILSCDGKRVYLRSQVFNLEGQRQAIGPHSGDFTAQGAVQRGPEAHLFAPMGFLDDTWFHRSYWVYGRSFAGGHAGYYQAGKFAPSGRILVTGGGYVYGYGRKPEHYRWTTVLEHQLFAASNDPPGVEKVEDAPQSPSRRRGQANFSVLRITPDKSLDPTNRPLTVEVWAHAKKPNGVILAHGGPLNGYALVIEKGSPVFHVRTDGNLSSVRGTKKIVNRWHHLAGVLTESKELKLYVDGKEVASVPGQGLIAANPLQGLQVGADEQSGVGEYNSPFAFTGLIDGVRIYHQALTPGDIQRRAEQSQDLEKITPVLAMPLDTIQGTKASPFQVQLLRVKPAEGKRDGALQFVGLTGAARQKNQKPRRNSLVEPKWTADIPIYARAMVLADRTLFIAGPPDTINEHETFSRLSARDEKVQAELAAQDAALEGQQGGLLLVVDADAGEIQHRLELDTLPVWDGMAAAHGKLFLSTTDGRVIMLGK